MGNHAHLKLTFPETKAVILALVTMLEDMEEIQKKDIPWNIDAEETQREIMMATKTAIKKICKMSGISANMEPYKPGDEKEFLKPDQ